MGTKVLISGNEAIAESAIQAGCGFYAGYPITPQNELIAYMARRMHELRRPFIQAESELAAINMVFGASCTGARAMTSSSSPGISLKQEGISYLAGCELPAVIVNVVRAGPGLGNITPAQSDYFQSVKGGGHGDYHIIVLAPASAQEAFDLTLAAFDLADQYRVPVMLLLDATIGQMAEGINMQVSGQTGERNKPWALTGAKARPANIIRSLLLKDGALEEHNLHLQKKFREIENREARYKEYGIEGADYIVVAYGVSFRIARAVQRILSEQGIGLGVFQPQTLWPFPGRALYRACLGKKALFVFELSYGQMIEDVKLAVGSVAPVYFYGRSGGGVFSPQELQDFILKTLNLPD